MPAKYIRWAAEFMTIYFLFFIFLYYFLFLLFVEQLELFGSHTSTPLPLPYKSPASGGLLGFSWHQFVLLAVDVLQRSNGRPAGLFHVPILTVASK
jgi:hypothetical protein